MGKTKKDHKCQFCGKIIPKGTDTNDIIIEADGGTVPHYHTLGSHHGAYSRWGYRYYFHKDCYIIAELCNKRKRNMPDLFVFRSAHKLTYVIGDVEEIEISLVNEGPDVEIRFESLAKAIRKENEIYELSEKLGINLLKLDHKIKGVDY